MDPEEKKEKPLERPRFTKLSHTERDAEEHETSTRIDNPLPRSKRILQAEERVRALQKQKIEEKEEMHQYQLDVLIRICTEIAQGKIWWVPHFMEQMGYGIIDFKAAKAYKDDFPRLKMHDYIIEYARRELSSGFRYSSLVKYLIEWLQVFRMVPASQRWTENPFFTQNYPLDEIYIRRIGFCSPVQYPRLDNCQELMMMNKHNLPADGLFYSFYQMMMMLAHHETDPVFGSYCKDKLRILRGESNWFDPGKLKSRPDLIEDLKQTRRWTLFDLYELEMERRAATRLLLCAREREPGCPFHKDAFPLDLLKILFVLADLLPTDEEREKLRGRAYYHFVEK